MTALFLGLISGTSADGIDVALAQFDPAFSLIAARSYPYPEALRRDLLHLGQGADCDLDRLGEMDAWVAECFAGAALALLREAGVPSKKVRALGSHGQTLRHRPYLARPFTLQIGDPARIAELTGINTIADFRRADIAAGGHGAPLAPILHQALFASPHENRAVLNLGGIANVTTLPTEGPVQGWDIGPANALLDAWCAACTGQGRDESGALARSGEMDPELLKRLNQDPWLTLPPPKSTGREHFNLDWLRPRLGSQQDAATVMATLVRFSALLVADALTATGGFPARLIACGGGVHNETLMSALQEALPETRVETTAAQGLDPDFVEAVAFAWLARAHLLGQPGNLPSVTGARGDRVLGAHYPAAPRPD